MPRFLHLTLPTRVKLALSSVEHLCYKKLKDTPYIDPKEKKNSYMLSMIICIWYINVYPYRKIKSVISHIYEWNVSHGFRQKNIITS